MIDPNDFIITRKRKKYKFAKFANAGNCFELEQWRTSPTRNKHINSKGQTLHKVEVEVGAGTGLFCVELARMHPEKSFVAIDVKADRLQKGAYAAKESGLTNISFVRARADQLDEMFAKNSIERIWVTFPDPFPKKRSAGRRLTHPTYLKKYETLLTKTGSLCIKHDNPEFFQWTLEQLVAHAWTIKELSFDLQQSELSDEYKIATTYEQRWLAEGRITQFVRGMR